MPVSPSDLNNSREWPIVLAVGMGGDCLCFFFSRL